MITRNRTTQLMSFLFACIISTMLIGAHLVVSARGGNKNDNTANSNTHRRLMSVVLAFAFSVSAQEKPHPIDAALAACKKKRGASTRGEAECLTSALQAWQRDIDRSYAGLKKLLKGDELKASDADQRDWLNYQDQQFDAINQQLRNKRGTMWVAVRIQRRIDIVKPKALELESHLQTIRGQKSGNK